jgi:hypothetical protein
MNFKKFKTVLLINLGVFIVLGIIARTSVIIPSEIDVQSISTNLNVRIFVVRPSFWDEAGAKQFLRTAPSATDLNNKTNINYHTISGYTSDTYYDNSMSGAGTFNEYNANGIVYYDIPKSRFFNSDTSSYLHFDLIRENPNNSNDIWTDTGNHQFSLGMNHRILRIFGNGGGLVTNISGIEAESRNISNTALSPILAGYLTCENSDINGYGAYANLRDNFNLEGRSGLDSVNLTDFTFTNTAGTITYDYTVSGNRSATTNLQVKVNRMRSMSGN